MDAKNYAGDSHLSNKSGMVVENFLKENLLTKGDNHGISDFFTENQVQLLNNETSKAGDSEGMKQIN